MPLPLALTTQGPAPPGARLREAGCDPGARRERGSADRTSCGEETAFLQAACSAGRAPAVGQAWAALAYS